METQLETENGNETQWLGRLEWKHNCKYVHLPQVFRVHLFLLVVQQSPLAPQTPWGHLPPSVQLIPELLVCRGSLGGPGEKEIREGKRMMGVHF